MRIYLPLKVIFTETTCLPKLKSITVLLYDFSTLNFTFVVEAMFNLRTFSQVSATKIL